ncbi:MAG: hypothetical protein GX677_10010, partial [Treponema sp.]|nr:hypothetical protein [Treponema sp.]
MNSKMHDKIVHDNKRDGKPSALNTRKKIKTQLVITKVISEHSRIDMMVFLVLERICY